MFAKVNTGYAGDLRHFNALMRAIDILRAVTLKSTYFPLLMEGPFASVTVIHGNPKQMRLCNVLLQCQSIIRIARFTQLM